MLILVTGKVKPDLYWLLSYREVGSFTAVSLFQTHPPHELAGPEDVICVI